ncbi:hypothetical protein [Actinomadura rupiterrae]|uniref:hypothetical protein n=1 Tax=Actinomadura rupiterrae TaxID=559627 RepID=UPI0020A4F1C3|nr:hypothetical protein [Actinomadura rupiterrae]MCP2342170.1 hypothetical protein [Actinomadura rupiterrae]
MALPDALAAMLTNDAELALLQRDPAGLRERYALTDTELAMLVGARPAGYQVTRRNVQAKLWRAVNTRLPVTAAHLRDHQPDLWDEFASTVVRPPRPVHEHGIWESERLTTWLVAQDHGPLAAYARYELERAKLGRTGTGTPAGLRPAIHRRRVSADRLLTLAAGARVVVFDYDVTAGPPIHQLPERRTHVALHRRARDARVLAYRINAATASLLACCDGTQTADQIIERIGHGEDQAAIRAALDGLLAAELVRLT